MGIGKTLNRVAGRNREREGGRDKRACFCLRLRGLLFSNIQRIIWNLCEGEPLSFYSFLFYLTFKNFSFSFFENFKSHISSSGKVIRNVLNLYRVKTHYVLYSYIMLYCVFLIFIFYIILCLKMIKIWHDMNKICCANCIVFNRVVFIQYGEFTFFIISINK
jgi:hypothetical protein